MTALEETPLMKQYGELKARAGDALLLFRMGDFYELFGEDAIEASRILEITLTSRDKNRPNPTPMAGVPHHSVQGYIQRLLRAGRKVAIGEQMEDPALVSGKQIVRRELVRIFTPGVQFDLEGSEACFIAALAPASADRWALACLDVSTGEALVADSLAEDSLGSVISGLPIRHLLRTEAADLNLSLSASVLVEKLPSNYLSAEGADEVLRAHYEVARLDAFVADAAARLALGTVVTYALRAQRRERLPHLRPPRPLHHPGAMVLGPRSAEHLDLLPVADGTPSLYGLMNRTRSAVGARQLRRWLLEPLAEPPEIVDRQSAVRELAPRLSKAAPLLSELYDIERIIGRVSTGLASPRDTLALGRTLSALAPAAALTTGATSPGLRRLGAEIMELHDRLGPLAVRITSEQKDEAPPTARDGGIFRAEADQELARLLGLAEDGGRWLMELESRERAASGIPSLKVRYNRVFGYYIEITQAHARNAPAHYQRKQTTVGAERFFTEELKKFEEEILGSGSRQRALEQDLFERLLVTIAAETPAIMRAAAAFAELDALYALAVLAAEPGWVFPEIDSSAGLEIREGRHPMVDQALRGGFVPNDLVLSGPDRMTLVITGPNMGGKSTVMRQTALIVLLGQCGAPVPAASARWGAVSSLYTRIGAHDAIARGQSTFMVEMTELAHILHHADERSLVILDEIGRGTSTYDGISVAWASLEWIATRIRCRTLFATHYHELTRLASELQGTANAHMAVDSGAASEPGRERALRFLYELREGPAEESFGVHVARIAGLPKPVIARAWSVLEELERHAPHAAETASAAQLSLFAAPEARPEPAAPPAPQPHPVLRLLAAADINEMTPLQALNFVVKLQEMRKTSDA